MKSILLSTAAIFTLATASLAQGANFSVDAFAQGSNTVDATIAGVATAEVDVPLSGQLSATGGLRFNIATEAVDGFYVGVESGLFAATYGDWNDIFIVTSHMRSVNGNPVTMTSLANPALADTQLTLGYANYAAMVGFQNSAVNTDIQNVQVAATFNLPYSVSAAVAVDYNNVTNTTIYGVSAEGSVNVVDVFAAVTYDTQSAYELGVGYAGFDAYVSGSEAQTVNFVGVGYSYAVADTADLWTTVSYNTVTEVPQYAAGFSVDF